MKQLRKIEPHSPEYERLANAEARSRVQMYPCADCGGPVINGYCCERCGSTNPRTPSADRAS
jgi:hypothetical protein